ncbi:hypothetical protein B0T21DRAFT_448026 [Apiosordaria backusii]|uniref:Uncharacterized protein n=1 Tax=Apiosordaria backusii TaxID=314023 RepID=A0AA40ET02_9PEZI|nr:hypothetical protein B0T21DRAFT_448026 [Apiosordaria backusii]
MDTCNDKQQEDLRKQPWREWIKEELEARKKADETEEGRKALEEKAKAYFQQNEECGSDGTSNKAG